MFLDRASQMEVQTGDKHPRKRSSTIQDMPHAAIRSLHLSTIAPRCCVRAEDLDSLFLCLSPFCERQKERLVPDHVMPVRIGTLQESRTFINYSRSSKLRLEYQILHQFPSRISGVKNRVTLASLTDDLTEIWKVPQPPRKRRLWYNDYINNIRTFLLGCRFISCISFVMTDAESAFDCYREMPVLSKEKKVGKTPFRSLSLPDHSYCFSY